MARGDVLFAGWRIPYWIVLVASLLALSCGQEPRAPTRYDPCEAPWAPPIPGEHERDEDCIKTWRACK
jgi:hypothetical protein